MTARVGARTCRRDGERGHPIERVRVVTRCGNYSAFNGYHWTPSDYSALICLDCGEFWRTKGAYADLVPDATARERAAR